MGLLGNGSFLQEEIDWTIQWFWHFGKMSCTVSGALDRQGFFIFILLSFFSLYNALNFLVIFCFLKKQNHLFCMTYWLKNIYITYCCKQKKNNTKNHQKPSTINSCFQNFVLMAIFYFFIGVIMAFNTWQTSNKYRSASCSGLLLSDFTAAEPLEFAGFCSQCDICLLFN